MSARAPAEYEPSSGLLLRWGAFNDVLTQIIVALKILPADLARDQTFTLRFLREARAAAQVKHPNIVGVHQVFEDNHTAYMALDFVRGRDLLDIVDEEPERLNPDRIRSMLRKILEAVEYIHDRGILHRDISPDNILLEADNTPVLIDFGAVKEHLAQDRGLDATIVGTFVWPVITGWSFAGLTVTTMPAGSLSLVPSLTWTWTTRLPLKSSAGVTTLPT